MEGDRPSGAPEYLTSAGFRAGTLLLSRADVERQLAPKICVAAVEDVFRRSLGDHMRRVASSCGRRGGQILLQRLDLELPFPCQLELEVNASAGSSRR
jgi:hypothetical protein